MHYKREDEEMHQEMERIHSIRSDPQRKTSINKRRRTNFFHQRLRVRFNFDGDGYVAVVPKLVEAKKQKKKKKNY